ncbi:phosphoribosylglycinamide formyltransferase [candidate division KSB1 bacterium]|nr:phosphoribosylglycinamide formyltransferase [candidate division KSB1 bacterium]
MLSVCVFASGRGSNFQALLDQIDQGKVDAQVVLVISNKSSAGALEIARKRGIPALHISDVHFSSTQEYVERLLALLQEHGVGLIVLAGYLKMVPSEVITRYRHRIINIHPALLPSFGGKGLYGHFVHEAVLAYGCKVSGATVHIVDIEYDTGPPIVQKCVPVHDDDTPDTLAVRVLQVEHEILPQVVHLFAQNRVVVSGHHVRILPERREEI